MQWFIVVATAVLFMSISFRCVIHALWAAANWMAYQYNFGKHTNWKRYDANQWRTKKTRIFGKFFSKLRSRIVFTWMANVFAAGDVVIWEPSPPVFSFSKNANSWNIVMEYFWTIYSCKFYSIWRNFYGQRVGWFTTWLVIVSLNLLVCMGARISSRAFVTCIV